MESEVLSLRKVNITPAIIECIDGKVVRYFNSFGQDVTETLRAHFGEHFQAIDDKVLVELSLIEKIGMDEFKKFLSEQNDHVGILPSSQDDRGASDHSPER
jgi:hypothetical protein